MTRVHVSETERTRTGMIIRNRTNRAKPVSFASLLPVILPQLDEDRAKKLQLLYNRLKGSKISKEYFTRTLTRIVGVDMLTSAVKQVHSREDVPYSKRVPVGNYYVNESISSILSWILNKHGDIAEGCKLDSAAIRSNFLESICFLIQDLGSKEVNRIKQTKLKEMLAVVKDAESAGINVVWLSSVVHRMREELELIEQMEAIETEKREVDLNVEIARKDFAEKVNEVEEMEGRLSQLEQKGLELRERIVLIRSKVGSVDYKSMVADIFTSRAL